MMGVCKKVCRMARTRPILEANKEVVMANSTPEAKKYRTLIRVLKIKANSVRLLVPASNHVKSVTITKDVFPESLRKVLSENARFFALADLKSDSAEDLARSITPIKFLANSKTVTAGHSGNRSRGSVAHKRALPAQAQSED